MQTFHCTTTGWAQRGSNINGSSSGAFCGWAVALNDAGNILAVGYRGEGAVRIFQYSGGAWSQLGNTLTQVTDYDKFGSSVSLNAAGTIVAIGATSQGAWGSWKKPGLVQVFEYSGGTWTQRGSDIEGTNDWDEFGGSVELNAAGDIVVIGATEGGSGSTAPEDTGRAEVFQYSGGTWTQIGSNIDGQADGDYFGKTVSINGVGDRVAIGAPYFSGAGSDGRSIGHVQIFQNSVGAWSQLGSDITGVAMHDQCGTTLSLNNCLLYTSDAADE